MRKFTGTIFLSLATLSLMFSGCGGTSGTGTPTVSGVAAAGSPLAGTAYLKDAAVPSKELTATIKSDGSYTFDVTGMQGPFILEATGTVGATNYTLHSFATGPGTANINPLSNLIVASAAGGTDPAQIFASPSQSMLQGIAANLPAADSSLMTSLKPLVTQFGAAIDPISGQFVANHTGLDAMLDAVTMTFSAGTITVMNKSTNAIIFTAQATNIAGGTFTMGNMPSAPTQTPTTTPSAFDGAAFYTANCVGCHGPLASSSKLGATATQIQAAITGNMGGMGQFSSLTGAQVQEIANALNPGASTTPTTPTTTPTTSPTTTPTTTPTAFDGAAFYTANCDSCHGPLATSSKLGATATQIQTAITGNMGGMGQFSSLTAAQVQEIANALIPSASSTPTTPTTTPTNAPALVCGTCHAIPPATGRHSKHTFTSCATCHGTGYSSTTVNTATHNNGVKDVGGTSGWNPTTRSCSNSCHGTRSW
jgi:mono/diheme cytochrome c family protein